MATFKTIGPVDPTNFKPRHSKDRQRKSFKKGDKCYVVTGPGGTFLNGQTGEFGDAGDAELFTLAQAHKLATGDMGVLNVSTHPQLAVLFFTNR